MLKQDGRVKSKLIKIIITYFACQMLLAGLPAP